MTTKEQHPGRIGRLRSRQAGHPSGLLGRIVGRAMVKDTAAANDHALELLALDAPTTVLEVGFGQGRTAAKLLAAGHQVLGVEVSATMVRQATARNRAACADGRAELVAGNGRTLPFADRSAAAALTVHTVYFMPDPAVTVTEIARVLQPGGRLAMAARIGDDPMPAWMDPAIYRIPTAARIDELFGQAGFEVEHHSPEDSHSTHLFVGRLPA